MAQREGQSVMAAALMAGILGAGIGLLMAPRSGKETRMRIRDAVVDAKQRAKEGWDDTKDQLDDKLKKASGAKDKLAGAIRSVSRKSKNNENMDPSGMEPTAFNNWKEEV